MTPGRGEREHALPALPLYGARGCREVVGERSGAHLTTVVRPYAKWFEPS